jgi:hypothetical protein
MNIIFVLVYVPNARPNEEWRRNSHAASNGDGVQYSTWILQS